MRILLFCLWFLGLIVGLRGFSVVERCWVVVGWVLVSGGFFVWFIVFWVVLLIGLFKIVFCDSVNLLV